MDKLVNNIQFWSAFAAIFGLALMLLAKEQPYRFELGLFLFFGGASCCMFFYPLIARIIRYFKPSLE